MGWLGWIVIAVMFWSLGPVMAKLGLGRLEPLTALTVRTMSTALVLVLVTTLRGGWSELRHVDPRAALFVFADGLTGSLLAHLAYYYALRLGPASAVIPISATYPVVALFVSALVLREQITAIKFVGVLLIIGGVYLVQRL